MKDEMLTLTVRLTAEERDRLKWWADRGHWSLNTAIRVLIHRLPDPKEEQ